MAKPDGLTSVSVNLPNLSGSDALDFTETDTEYHVKAWKEKFEEVTARRGMTVANVNYVKKVVFPMEILPVIAMCASRFHTAIAWAGYAWIHKTRKGFANVFNDGHL